MRAERVSVPLGVAIALLAICWWGITTASAEAPTVIAYQGRLTDSSGQSINATLPMTLALYAVPEGGAAAWVEAHPAIAVTGGLFTVYLGEIVPLSSAVLNDNAYLGLTVGADSEMRPRQRLGSVPFARTLAPGAEIRWTSSSSATLSAFNVDGQTPAGPGIVGEGNPGVFGWSSFAPGVAGRSDTGWGMYGTSDASTAVVGAAGVPSGQPDPGLAAAFSAPKAGVFGYSSMGPGGYFSSTTTGLYATGLSGPAIVAYKGGPGQGYGFDHTIVASGGPVPGLSAIRGSGSLGPGVHGSSSSGTGVLGEGGRSGGGPVEDPLKTVTANQGAGVMGYSSVGPGIFAWSTFTHSLVVSGSALITGNLLVGGDVISNADVAENYVGTGTLEPGDVVVLDPSIPLGVRRADQAHDTTVAGIISTDPAIVLPGAVDGVPLALVGRVPVKADASYGAIQVGDLLTTSATPGHVMRCADRLQCVGAVAGKALEPLDGGTGIILVLVTLQ